jgi:hypothetical protein
MLAASCGVGDLLVIEARGGQPRNRLLPSSPIGVVNPSLAPQIHRRTQPCR